MRIAVLEAVCAGLCGDDPSPSLLAEGLAMWRAVVDDLLANPEVTIATVIDFRRSRHAPPSPRLQSRNVTDAVQAIECWQSCLEGAEASWIIAPESDTLLERLVSTSESGTVTSLNASPTAIRLCTDKLALADHLQKHGIPTVATIAETWQSPPPLGRGVYVVKPRDGAGSHLVRRINNRLDWTAACIEFSETQPQPAAIRQPYIAGQSLSIAGWFDAHGVRWFPVAEQRLSSDERFTYLGGVIPANIATTAQAAIQKLAADAAATIPGLRSYIGFDVVVPVASPAQPVLVEINPRLTTSSIGIRRLCADNWLARLLTEPTHPLRWHTDRRIHFTATGDVREEWLP